MSKKDFHWMINLFYYVGLISTFIFFINYFQTGVFDLMWGWLGLLGEGAFLLMAVLDS